MKLFRTALSLVAVSAFTAVVALAFPDTTPLTWVSGTGEDTGNCNRSEPCATFAYALSVTSAGGEIDAVDAGNFGQVLITKSVTIDGGTVAFYTPPARPATSKPPLPTEHYGIQVNAPGATVTLRNLKIQGFGSGQVGILFEGGTALHIEHCTISNFIDDGILIQGNTDNQVFIEDTISRDNGNAGLGIENSGGYSYVQISDSHFANNVNGIESGSASRTTVRNSDVSGNSAAGFRSDATHGSSFLSVTDSAATHNGVGAQAGGTDKVTWVRLSNVLLIGNSPGINVLPGGTVASWGNNHNGDNGSPNAQLAPQ